MMVVGMVGGAITTITMQASTTSTASTITVPSCQDGDILVLFDRPLGSSPPASVIPSGWSTGNVLSSGNYRMFVSYKLATNADSGASVTGMNGSISNAKMMYVFRPDVAASVLTLGSSVGTVTTTAADAVATTLAGSGTAPLVVLGSYSRNGTVSPRGMSPAKDGEITATNAYLAYKIFNSSPANVTVTTPGNTSANSAQALYLVPTLV